MSSGGASRRNTRPAARRATRGTCEGAGRFEWRFGRRGRSRDRRPRGRYRHRRVDPVPRRVLRDHGTEDHVRSRAAHRQRAARTLTRGHRIPRPLRPGARRGVERDGRQRRQRPVDDRRDGIRGRSARDRTGAQRPLRGSRRLRTGVDRSRPRSRARHHLRRVSARSGRGGSTPTCLPRRSCTSCSPDPARRGVRRSLACARQLPQPGRRLRRRCPRPARCGPRASRSATTSRPRRRPGTRPPPSTSRSRRRRCSSASSAAVVRAMWRTPDEVEVGGRTIPLREAVMPSTVPQNLAGLPSVTVPVGLDAGRHADRHPTDRRPVDRAHAPHRRLGARAIRRGHAGRGTGLSRRVTVKCTSPAFKSPPSRPDELGVSGVRRSTGLRSPDIRAAPPHSGRAEPLEYVVSEEHRIRVRSDGGPDSPRDGRAACRSAGTRSSRPWTHGDIAGRPPRVESAAAESRGHRVQTPDIGCGVEWMPADQAVRASPLTIVRIRGSVIHRSHQHRRSPRPT